MRNVLKRAGDNRLIFRCPGCDAPHQIAVGDGNGPRWGWNNSMDKPTFTPSVLVRTGHHVTGKAAAECQDCIESAADGDPTFCSLCHSFITDGRIQFLTDSTHALAGQTVDLPLLPNQEHAHG